MPCKTGVNWRHGAICKVSRLFLGSFEVIQRTPWGGGKKRGEQNHTKDTALFFSCAEIQYSALQKLPEIFWRGCCLVRFPPPVRFAPPHTMAQVIKNNLKRFSGCVRCATIRIVRFVFFYTVSSPISEDFLVLALREGPEISEEKKITTLNN